LRVAGEQVNLPLGEVEINFIRSSGVAKAELTVLQTAAVLLNTKDTTV
jgi:hypothetical protein